MSFLNNFKHINYKYCNLSALSLFGLFQSCKYFYDRNSNSIVNSFLNKGEDSTLLKNGLNESENLEKDDISLKRLDSYGFWAILENKTKKEHIYMKCKDLKKNLPTFLSLKEYKDKPYLLKKNLLQFKSEAKKNTQSSWTPTKTSQISPQKIQSSNRAGLATLSLFLIGFLCTLTLGVRKSVDVLRTLSCANFIRNSCRNHQKVNELIGSNITIRNLDGQLSRNYFSGDIVISGNSNKQLLINLVVMRDHARLPFKLLKLKVLEVL